MICQGEPLAPAVARGKFYGGDLRADLIRASLDLIATEGLREFSVSKVAKQLNVSSAAPYRHFADRVSLLAAVAAEAAEMLRVRIELAVAAEADPGEALVASVSACTGFLIERRISLEVIFSKELDPVGSDELAFHRRLLLADSMSRCRRVSGPGRSRSLLEQLISQATGSAAVFLGDIHLRPRSSAAHAVHSATEAARVLIGAALRSARGSTAPGRG